VCVCVCVCVWTSVSVSVSVSVSDCVCVCVCVCFYCSLLFCLAPARHERVVDRGAAQMVFVSMSVCVYTRVTTKDSIPLPPKDFKQWRIVSVFFFWHQHVTSESLTEVLRRWSGFDMARVSMNKLTKKCMNKLTKNVCCADGHDLRWQSYLCIGACVCECVCVCVCVCVCICICMYMCTWSWFNMAVTFAYWCVCVWVCCMCMCVCVCVCGCICTSM